MNFYSKQLNYVFFVLLIIFGVSLLTVGAEPQPDNSMILQRLDELDASVKKQSSWISPSSVVPLIAAFGGWIVAFYSLWGTRKTQEKVNQLSRTAQEIENEKQHLFDALSWFEGGTQKRSIGISIIEANWDKHNEMKPVWSSLLITQAIHILLNSGERNSETEQNNIERIMSLLQKQKFDSPIANEQRISLRNALEKASLINETGEEIEKNKNKKGVFLEEKKVKSWLTAF